VNPPGTVVGPDSSRTAGELVVGTLRRSGVTAAASDAGGRTDEAVAPAEALRVPTDASYLSVRRRRR
jgi:hypothetical protein